MGECMVEQANMQGTKIVTADLLQAAFQLALKKGEPYFTNLWTEYTGTAPAEIAAGQRLLHTLAHGKPLPPLEDPVARAALRRLERFHVVRPAGDDYTVEIPLVARWVRERAEFEEAGVPIA